MKISKAELDQFFKTLGPCFYWEDSDETPEDNDKLDPDTIMTVTCGVIYYQEPPSSKSPPKEIAGVISASEVAAMRADRHECLDFITALKRWRKSQNTMTVVIEFAKDDLEKVKAWAKDNRIKVISNK